MLETIRPTFEFCSWYAQKLVADIPDEKMAAQPVAGVTMNHPAWTIAHLAWTNDNILKMLGKTSELESWKEKVGMGSTPVSDRSKYPSKDELLNMLKLANARLWAEVSSAPEEVLKKPTPENMRHMFPTNGAMIIGVMTGHYASHLGQISAWRRAMGFPPVF
jgi:hypothetical protein